MKIILFIFILSHLCTFAFSQQETKSNALWKKVIPGGKHVIASMDDGSFWGWAYNGYGQLGTGSDYAPAIPTQICLENEFIEIDCGYMHSLALKDDGTIWGWGLNASGQSGQDELVSVFEPMQIGSDNDWMQLAAGSYTSFALKDDGSIWSWGLNSYLNLGLNNSDVGYFVSQPTMIGSDYDWDTIYAGEFFHMARKNDGSLWGWGYNFSGQLGIGPGTQVSQPVLISENSDWIDISMGIYHCIAIKNDSTLWSWGNNYKGALGTADEEGTTNYYPQQIGTQNNWAKITAGYYHSLALQNDGSLWAWGKNENGALGLNDNLNRYSPVLVNEFHYENIFAGNDYSFILDSTASQFCSSGLNESLQMANCTMYDYDSIFICNSIRAPIQITNQETSISSCINNTEILQIIATGVENYLWQVSTDDGTTWLNVENNETFSGAETNILEINDITIDIITSIFRCILSTPCVATDTSEVIYLNITIPNSNTYLNQNEICAENQHAQYQWFNCDTEMIITNEIFQCFSPNESGNYSVILNENSCVDTSQCYYFEALSLATSYNGNPEYIFDNIDKILQISMVKDKKINIYDTSGREILQRYSHFETIAISLNWIKPGLYYLMVFDEYEASLYKIIIE